LNSPNEPHIKRQGWLRNGNPPGDPTRAPRCGAKARHGGMCRAPSMKNGRCRFHGGKSTGPKTEAGLSRSRRANWRHGRFSKNELENSAKIRELINAARAVLFTEKNNK
jgi:hypothetical protein